MLLSRQVDRENAVNLLINKGTESLQSIGEEFSAVTASNLIACFYIYICV